VPSGHGRPQADDCQHLRGRRRAGQPHMRARLCQRVASRRGHSLGRSQSHAVKSIDDGRAAFVIGGISLVDLRFRFFSTLIHCSSPSSCFSFCFSLHGLFPTILLFFFNVTHLVSQF